MPDHHCRPRRLDDGASAAEYSLLVAGIAAVIVAVVLLLGTAVGGSLQDSCDTVKTGGATTAATCS